MNSFNFFRKIAFLFDPEFIHNASIAGFSLFPRGASVLSIGDDEKYHLSDGHMRWKFPIGLAAGLDKNAQALEFFNRIGFGAIEAGTVTPKPQSGNSKPRIWRMDSRSSLRNAMGFPNVGSVAFLENIKKSSKPFCLGINLGKNKLSENDLEDYIYLMKCFKDQCDYLAINISSPNTQNLRALQNSSFLTQLKDEFDKLNSLKPIYIKVSPDMNEKATVELTQKCIDLKFNGIICTNTTANHNYGSGGVSGLDLKQIAKKKREEICKITKGIDTFSTIGVGGVQNSSDLFDFWKSGGDMMQVYTSFIYKGPQILIEIKNDIDQKLNELKLKNVSELQKYFKGLS